jgi:cilia- and flagella-associated protein 298
MVFLVIKRPDNSEFLYETVTSTSVQSLLQDVVSIFSHRERVVNLCMAITQLAKHGPIRPEETRGLSGDVAAMSGLNIEAYGIATSPDEHRQRTGVPPPEQIGNLMLQNTQKIEQDLKNSRQTTTLADLNEKFNILRGCVMIAYPAYHRLPIYDPVREILEDKTHLNSSDYVLWWAGKELVGSEKTLGDFVGKNEKSKIIVRLQEKKSGPPVREASIDENTHKAMLEFYYKRQNEQKNLKEDDDDSYLTAKWADPKGLKNHLVHGGGNLKWKI